MIAKGVPFGTDYMKKQYKIGLCGHLNSDAVGENGQTVRTNNIKRQLQKHYGENAIICISTHNWKKKPFSLLIGILKMCVKSESVILFPNTRSIKTILPFCVLLKRILRIRVYYNVIGAWLPRILDETKWLKRYVKKLDALFIQTDTLQQQLKERGIEKTVIFPNFKELNCVEEKDVERSFSVPLPVCFFSRVTEKKGVEDAINAVNRINADGIKLSLDIYGPVDENYKSRFDQILKESPEYIKYKGVVENNKTPEILRDYFVQVFPTHYPTEGHPGSLIDSLYAALPVVSARWNSCYDVVFENETGITYEFGNVDDLVAKLKYCIEHQNEINSMRRKCFEYSKRYSPEEVMKNMINVLDGTN